MDEAISHSQSHNDSQYSDMRDPQVTSADPYERKIARRLRIERRIETLRRQNVPEGEEVEEKVAEKKLLQQQLEKSAEVLEKLILEGNEFVTNVRIANDSREVDRREEEGIGREKIIEHLEEEAALATDMFNEIANKWNEILKNNDPLHIHEDMNIQKQKCEELIKQKDGIIAMLRDEIKNAERKFTNDQYKQNEDIKTLAKRIEKQVKLMRKAYRRELEFIGEVLVEERKLLVEANDKHWDELYKRRENEERTQCEKKFEQHEEFIQEMNKLRIEHQEKFREAKIRLEKEVEELQKELERIKTMAIMNSEKLDYNYQILRKREDENLIINSQQKRRINKLQDIINNLRRKNQDYDETTKNEIKRLTSEVMKMQKCVVEIEHKAVSLSKINDQKYNKVWDLNVANANTVLNKILTIDRILHEQQLGMEWKRPDIQLLKRRNLLSCKHGIDVVDTENRDRLKKEKEMLDSKQSRDSSTKVLMKDTPIYKNLLRHILEQIAGKAGFLLEERLNTILEPYLKHEKTMVTMDNVFTALGVKEQEDIDILIHFFLPYARCNICTKMPPASVRPSAENMTHATDEDDDDDDNNNTDEISIVDSDEGKSELFRHMMTTVNQPDDVITEIVNELVGSAAQTESSSSIDSKSTTISCMPPIVTVDKSENESLKTTKRKSQHGLRLTCKNNHPLQINPVFVIKALREFITKFYVDTSGVESLADRLAQKHTTISRLMTDDDVKMFWERYRKVFSDGKQRLWDGLFFGLQKYHEILRDRKKINDEVMCLRKQNAELKQLLGKYGNMRKPPCAMQRQFPITDDSIHSCDFK